jgi:hypothetical protein
MVCKKTPPPCSSIAALRDELEYLYLRRLLVENLIRAMEVYTLMGHGPKGKTKLAA